MRASQVVRFVLSLVLVNVVAFSTSCGSGEMQEPEVAFSPISPDERGVHRTIVEHIDAAQALLKDARLSNVQRTRLQEAIAVARHKLARFMAKRQQGYTQSAVMAGLGSASAGVVSNDVTIVGVADDWILLPIAVIAIGSKIILDSPASPNDLESAWLEVGTSMRDLGREIEAVGKELGQSTAQAGLKPRPAAPPVHRVNPKGTEQTIDILPNPPVPSPIPKSKEKPRKKREECVPKRFCPHKGGDTWHNYCADTVLRNEFSGCDVMVNGKAYDAKSGNTLYEVKTDDWDTYAEFLTERVLDQHAHDAKVDSARALACGYQYEFIVGDATLEKELSKRTAPLDVVRLEPKCNRKPYKAGKTKFGKPGR